VVGAVEQGPRPETHVAPQALELLDIQKLLHRAHKGELRRGPLLDAAGQHAPRLLSALAETQQPRQHERASERASQRESGAEGGDVPIDEGDVRGKARGVGKRGGDRPARARVARPHSRVGRGAFAHGRRRPRRRRHEGEEAALG